MAKKANARSAKAKPTISSSKAVPRKRKPPTHETLQIYRPDDIALSVSKLFPKEAKDWKDQASDQGFLRIRPAVMQGIVGLYGSLTLGNPPSPVDIEAWEACKPKDCWDYWSLFDFISVPTDGKKGGLDVILFHSQHSLQERPLEIAHRIHLPKTEAECFITEQSEEISEATEAQTVAREWARLRTALEARFDSVLLSKQKWTVGTKVYDISYPDQ
jgi:hypothetical protein